MDQIITPDCPECGGRGSVPFRDDAGRAQIARHPCGACCTRWDAANPPPRPGTTPTAPRGDWQQTYSGHLFWPADPRPADIHPVDIAHALSLQCRFGGHCLRFYSVAEHCVRVSRTCDPADALWGLLHDASEAYLVDVPRPAKRLLPEYMVVEHNVMTAVCDRFGLAHGMPTSVRAADEILLATEARDLMAPPPAPWMLTHGPLPEVIQPWAPAEAEAQFLARLTVLWSGGAP